MKANLFPLLLDGVLVEADDAGHYVFLGRPEHEAALRHEGVQRLLVYLNAARTSSALALPALYAMALVKNGIEKRVALALVKQIHPLQGRAMWQ